MPGQMREPAFRADQESRLREPHIAPITEYIQGLRDSSGEWVPWVAPLHGGVGARVLSVLRDPGPMVHLVGGSGMICIENDDQTAKTLCGLIVQAGLTPRDVIPWNAYPWYINKKPTPMQLRVATPTLLGLIDLLPKLEVVVLQGDDAQLAWRMALREQPALRRRRLEVFETYHPSVQALRSPDKVERERRIQNRIDTWLQVGEWLRGRG
jgi:hypothetical protein